MSEDVEPGIRASDDDRRRVVAALSEAFSRGQLDYAELDERTARVWATTHRAELLTPLQDLMPDPAGVLSGPPQAPADVPVPRAGADTARQQVTGEPGGQSFSFSLLGVSQKRGQWLSARTHASLALLGATTLDLRRARLSSHETTVWAFGVLGAVELLVPEDVIVHGDGIGVLGAFEVTRDGQVSVNQQDLPADAPVIRVRGLGLLGAVTVRRVPRGSPE